MKNQPIQPVFSVVIPVYNVERYIKECIESVLNQTYKNFEIVIVDDGSQDNSIRIARQYLDSRIRIVSQPNRGLAAARNTGINASRGMFIALLDSDDFWHPKKLQEHFHHFSNDRTIGVSYSASLFVDEDSYLLGIGQFPKTNNVKAEDIFCRNPIGNGSAPVIRKSLLQKVGKQVETEDGIRMHYFDETMRQSEDVEFWLRIALTTEFRFVGVARPLTYYRVNSGGLSANLEKQYQSWLYAVRKNRTINPQFFDTWFSLGSAFQKLYLARRAVKSGQTSTAFNLIHRALVEDIRILVREPKKTIETYICAWLGFLPKGIFNHLMEFVMAHSKSKSQAQG